MPLFAGNLVLPNGVVEGHIEVEDGRVVAWGEGEPDRKPDAKGWIVAAPVNAHTHVADAFLRSTPGKPDNVAQLVGPGGWKELHTRHADPATVAAGIHAYVDEMAALGTTRFIDFREGGLEGVKLLADLAADLAVQPFVMGRPAENDYHDDEARALLAECDGIGLSAARDFERFADVAAWAEACHRARKPFAVHVSEAKREPLEAILALEPSFLVHACQATKREMQAAADQEVPVVVCPRSNAKLGIRTPIAAMIEAGLTLAVGTDNGMLCDGNLLAELALIKTWAPKIDDEQLLRMTTAGRGLAGLPDALPPRRGAPLDLVVLPENWLPQGQNLKPGFIVGADA